MEGGRREGGREGEGRDEGCKESCCCLLTFPSARDDMTLLSERRDLLIVLASSSVRPSAFVLPTCGDKHTYTICTDME